MNKIKSLKKKSTINNNSFNNYNPWKLSKNILYNKYSKFKYSFSNICINNLMFNENCRIVSRFKDYLIYDDDTEFLRFHYKNELLRKTLKKVFNFYDQFNKVFPNYMILPENKYMYKNLRKKQKMIDECNKMLFEKQKREKENKMNLNNKNNKKKEINIFDETVKESINRQNNSMVSMSLANTIISNYINNNDNKKNGSILDLNSFIESSSINISLYTKRSFFNNNDNSNDNKDQNYFLYSNTLKSLSSLENIVDGLNNKKYKKIDIINNNKNKKHKFLNIDIISNNNKKNVNNDSNISKNHLKTQNFTIKTPTKNKLFKREKEKDIKQLYLFHHITINNNNKRFINHKKNTSDMCSIYPSIKHKIESLSKKKTSKYISKFHKEYNNTVIERITTSLFKKYKSKQRNKQKKINEEKHNSKSIKNVTLTKSTDNCEHKDNKIIKVNNYYTFRRINRNNKNNDKAKYNKIVKTKKRKVENEEKNYDENKSETIYKIFEEKFKSTLCNRAKEKGRPNLDADSTESTKLSFNNRKTKFNCHVTFDKINNNSNNQIYIYNNKIQNNKEVLQTQPKEEITINNNYNTFNNVNTESNVFSNTRYWKNMSKKNQRQKTIIFQNKIKTLHKKHKTYSSQIDNNDFLFSSINKKSMIEDNKSNYLEIKLKKIKQEILKNKNNFIEIKEKYRKLSENNKNKMLCAQNKKCEKIMTYSLVNNTSMEKKDKISNKENINNNNKNTNNELFSRINNKIIKKEKNNIIHYHQRHYSLMNNNFKSPLGRKLKKELTKDINPKNKDKIISSKVNEKRIIKKIKKCN